MLPLVRRHVTLVALGGLLIVFASLSHAELILIPATQMEGISSWKEGQSWGAGNFFMSNGTPVTKSVVLEGGEYKFYVRMYTAPNIDADIRIWLNEHCFIPPMQANVHKLGWIRLGSVVLPPGKVDLRVESPVVAQPSAYNFQALALCSTPLNDRVGRIIEFTDWLRAELIRFEAPQPPPHTLSEAEERRRVLRKQLLSVLGLDPLPERTPLNARVLGCIEKDDYTIEKVAFESRPNHVIPALLYLPKPNTGRVPAIVSAIGHWSHGKSSKAPQRRAIGLVKRGYAVLAVEACYAYERGIPGNTEGFEPLVAGGCVAGHMVWDIMRAVDYLETRPDIDASRLGITGASGGGLQTFYAGAVDERFDVVMPAVALWPMHELAVNAYYSADNWVPGISRLGGMSVLIGLTAPRGMLVMNMDQDYATSYACEVMVNAARPYYTLLGAENRLLHTIGKGPHDYTKQMRETTYAFVDRWLKGTGDGLPVSEEDFESELFDEADPALFVFPGGKIPTENAATVQDIWLEQAKLVRSRLPAHPRQLPQKLRDLLHMPPLEEPNVSETEGGFLITTDPGVHAAVACLGTGRRAIVWLGDSDLDTELKRPEVQALSQHASVFVLEPRGAGMPNEMHILRHATIVLGRPICSLWAYDVLCLVDYLARERGFDVIAVAGSGKESGLACVLATLLDKRIRCAGIDGLFSSFVQLVGYSNVAPQIPGILKITDIEHLVAAAGKNRIALNNLLESEFGKTLTSSSEDPTAFFSTWVKTL